MACPRHIIHERGCPRCDATRRLLQQVADAVLEAASAKGKKLPDERGERRVVSVRVVARTAGVTPGKVRKLLRDYRGAIPWLVGHTDNSLWLGPDGRQVHVLDRSIRGAA